MPRALDTRVKIYHLQGQQWQEYTKATLVITSKERGFDLKIAPSQPIPPLLLSVLPLGIINREEQCLLIGAEMVSRVQRTEDSIVAVYLEEWNRTLAFSFNNLEYCEIIFEQLEMQMNSESRLPCKENELLEYLTKQLENNLHFVDWFFNNQNITLQFIRYFEEHSGQFAEQQKRQAFNVAKKIFIRSDKKIFQNMLSREMYKVLLRCLSYNYEFGDRPCDYEREYERVIKYENALDLQEEQIVSAYESIMRIRFLLDYAASMFIEGAAIATLSEVIIRDKIVSIMEVLTRNPQYFVKLNQLAQTQPVIFVELFCELWEMFKSVMDDAVTQQIKADFYQQFAQSGLFEQTFNCVLRLANRQTMDNGSQTNTNNNEAIISNHNNRINSRLFQKFLQALNPLLTYRWLDSQTKIVAMYKQNKVHLGELLLAIIKQADYNLKSVVLLFARQLIEVSELRLSIRQSFISYIFNEFTDKMSGYWQSVSEMQIYVQYMIKCYQIDSIRSRRCMIDSGLIPSLQGRLGNKYILIMVLKLLRVFMRNTNEDVFHYLRRHRYLGGLRGKYYEMKKYCPNGVVYSNFIGLIKDCRGGSTLGGKYIYEIMFPEQAE